jgi:NADPH2:quinone reductase
MVARLSYAMVSAIAPSGDELIPFVESRAIDPLIGHVFTLDDVAAAIRELDERRAIGKMLIRLR